MLLAAWLVLPTAPPLGAEPPPSTGDPSLDSSLYRALRETLDSMGPTGLARRLGSGRGSAEWCRIDATGWTCRRLRLTTDRWTLEAARSSFTEDDGLEFSEFRARRSDTGQILQAAALEVRDGVVRARSVGASGDGGDLRVRRLMVRPEGVELVELRWRPLRRISDGGRWWSVPRLVSGGPVQLRAASARYAEGTWKFDQLRTNRPLPVAVGPTSGDRPTPASGLVPPDGTYSEGRLEILQRAFHGPTGIGGSVAVAPGDWYGVGPALNTTIHSDWPSTEGAGPDLLDAHLLYDADSGSVEGTAFGDLRFGEPLGHASGSIEEATRSRYWRTRRIGRDALFRPWRRSALGISLSGTSHHLQIRGAHWNRAGFDGGPGVRADRIPLSGREGELSVRFGTEAEFAERLDVSADLYHRNRSRAGEPDEHGTTLVAEVTRRFGRRSRLYGDVGLSSVLGTILVPTGGTDSTPAGFQASPVTQLVASARGGLVLRGDAGAVTHLVRPSVAVYREIAGRGTAPDSATSSPATFDRVPSWTLAGFQLDQSLRWGEWELGVPMGLYAVGAGAQEAASLPARLLIRAELERSRLRLRSGMLAPTDFGTGEGFGTAEWKFDPGSIAVGGTTLDPTGAAWLRADRSLGRAPETLRLLEGQQPFVPSDEPFSAGDLTAFATAEVDVGMQHLEATAYGDGRFDRGAVSAGWTYRFGRVGWGLGVEGGTSIPTDTWGFSAGLRRAGGRR